MEASALYDEYPYSSIYYYYGGLFNALGRYRVEPARYRCRVRGQGALWPHVARGRVFYVGRFSEGDKLCRYPVAPESVGDRRVGFGLQAFDPRQALARRDAGIEAASASTQIGPYRPLAYANPFDMWALYPDLQNIGRSVRVFGIFFLQDPTAANTLTVNAGYDASFPFADASVSWENDELPVAFTTSLGDTLVYGASGPPERQSSAAVFASLNLPFSPRPRAAIFRLGGSAFARWDGPGGSPYAWGYSGRNATASGMLGWQGRIPGVAASTSRGIDLVTYHDLDIASLAYKTEVQLVAAYDRVPLRLDAWGAWAASPILKLDSTSSVFSSDHRPAYVEFDSIDVASSNLLVEGTLAYRLADQAIHSNLLDLYVNRLLVDIGFRGAYFRDGALVSTFARLSLDLAGAQGFFYQDARLFGEVFARLDGSTLDRAVGYRLGYQLSTDEGASLVQRR